MSSYVTLAQLLMWNTFSRLLICPRSTVSSLPSICPCPCFRCVGRALFDLALWSIPSWPILRALAQRHQPCFASICREPIAEPQSQWPTVVRNSDSPTFN
nr:putative integron gene cassette protein [uncultured bacterium]